MCSIIAGWDSKVVKDLIDINQHRGNFSYSYTEFYMNKPSCQVKDFGAFNKELIEDKFYKVCHVQAPTGSLKEDVARIHPVMNKENMLWHNGIVTPRGIKHLQKLLDSNEDFDTKLIFDSLEKFGFDVLSDIEGLFACLYYKDDSFYIFRSKHAKLYIDANMNISSEKFENSFCLPYDIVYRINLQNKSLEEISSFKTKRYNIVISGDDISNLIKT